MRSKRSTRLLSALLLGAAMPAAGQVLYQAGPGLNLAIPDNGYDGTLASMACSNLNVPDSGTIVALALRVGMVHTWIGDLVIKLRSPSTSLVTVVSRPGVVEPADDGSDTAGFGDSSNLVIGSPIDFADPAGVSAETMGALINDAQVVCRDDSICFFAPDHGAALPGNLGTFTGQSMQGTWQLCIGDSGGGDLGSLDLWALVISSDLIFADGFESSDTGAWSLVFP